MGRDERLLVVPLRSNAHALLSTQIERMRRRLKLASLLYDGVILETGVLQVLAGPSGGSTIITRPSFQEALRWQTPRERHASKVGGFEIAIGDVNGDKPPQVIISSKTTISWRATLHPFEKELPNGCDWVHFKASKDPSGGAKQLAQRWTQRDQKNVALQRALPVQFVRDVVIKHANRDLLLAGMAGYATSLDRVHSQVPAQRFHDPGGWNLEGFALPILFPAIGDRSWDEIRDLRMHKGIARFRKVLREVESEVRDSDGDYEAAAQRSYRRHLANAGMPGGLGGLARELSIFVGTTVATGLPTMAISDPLIGVIVGTAGATVVESGRIVRKHVRDRRAKGWLAVDQRLSQLTDPSVGEINPPGELL